MNLIALVAAASFSATAAHPADQFDLICKGQSFQRIGPGSDNWGEYSVEMRVDLKRGIWALVGRDSLNQFAEITPSTLTMRNDNTLNSYDTWTVDRVSGQMMGSSFNHNSILEIKGGIHARCEPAPYILIPENKF